MQTKKIILAPYTLSRYESGLDVYFFFNTQNSTFWETDRITGSVIATLDGTLSCEDIVKLLNKYNPDISIPELSEHFRSIFKFLLDEGYICEYI